MERRLTAFLPRLKSWVSCLTNYDKKELKYQVRREPQYMQKQRRYVLLYNIRLKKIRCVNGHIKYSDSLKRNVLFLKDTLKLNYLEISKVVGKNEKTIRNIYYNINRKRLKGDLLCN